MHFPILSSAIVLSVLHTVTGSAIPYSSQGSVSPPASGLTSSSGSLEEPSTNTQAALHLTMRDLIVNHDVDSKFNKQMLQQEYRQASTLDHSSVLLSRSRDAQDAINELLAKHAAAKKEQSEGAASSKAPAAQPAPAGQSPGVVRNVEGSLRKGLLRAQTEAKRPSEQPPPAPTP
ncbi:hypothetical protein BC835DRAFT_1388729 [Cytidiella melzeri]|nr:hypothetical protein BC835DRAFT_1388729 [Cytidiella melzeri]